MAAPADSGLSGEPSGENTDAATGWTRSSPAARLRTAAGGGWPADDVGAVNPSLSVLNATVPWSLPNSLFRVEPNATTAMTTMTAVATIPIRMI